MRFDKHNRMVLEILRKARPVGVRPTLFGFDQKTLVTAGAAVLVLLLIMH